MVAEKLCHGRQGMSNPVQIWSGRVVMNKWKGERRHYPIRDSRWRGRARENRGRFGGYFTTHNVSLLFSSYRDEVRHHGESGDQIQGMLPVFMSCKPHRYNTRIGMTIWNL